MLSIVDAILLAVLQGITEFLPISSSGHLVIAQSLLNIHSQAIMGFDVYLHFGTLISLLIVFWRDVQNMALSLTHSFSKENLKGRYQSDDSFRMVVNVLIGCVPAGVIGVLFNHQIEAVFHDPKMVAVNLVITGLILFLTRLSKPNENRKIGIGIALVIGLAQAVAILPGISRSGSTIAMGLFLGLMPVLAARFSFLLSIPVIAGAALLEAKNIFHYASELGLLPILIGIAVSAVSGYIAIKFLMKVMERGKFSLFAFYCLIVGVLAILFI
ncbi:MAG: undecaprenyl-diphosphate phosphatase [Bacteroidetes bacterium]|nr:undecaprenyl-diphosphate phosphatase [Bacteroidota bacterium]